MKNNKFEYFPSHPFFNPIVSAKEVIPDWYKKIPPYATKNVRVENYNKNLTVKQCVPFLDSLMSGFMITTQMDIQVVLSENGEPSVTWLLEPSPVFMREEGANIFPYPKHSHDNHFVWLLPLYFKTPKGYSLFLTHPLNRFDLPFTTLNGVIDAGNGIDAGGLPFFLDKGFEGIIPKGTPIAQIIPFKKENWIAVKNEKIRELSLIQKFNSESVVKGYYKANVWIKTLFQVKN